ncbi:MAG: MFS transporter [Elainellaceae cyanobacterium]
MLNRERLNVLLLALCQALSATGMTIVVTVASLVGYSLVTNKALATLPITVMQIATMLATIPASLLMKQLGRRRGFMLGSLLGILGAGFSVQGIISAQFPLFCLGVFCIGAFNSFAWYYRFAAADSASESFRPQAISLVVSGGVIAAIVGPSLASWAKDAFSTHEFAGSIAVIVGLQIMAIALLSRVHIPPMADTQIEGAERPLTAIARQPVFLAAVVGSMLGYGVMSLVMTATPLAMTNFDHSFEATASVIRWHVLGMFAPSFMTGFLIARFGVLNIILAGIAINSLCVAVNFSGTAFPHFSIALLLLGIGWNFMFIGSTTLLTEVYAPAEKSKVQAAHDFLTFSFVALCSLMSGQLLYFFSWNTINAVGLGGMAIALVANLWLRYHRRQIAQPLT